MQEYRLPAAFRIRYGSLDEEHAELIGLLNRLRALGREGGHREEATVFIEALKAHFTGEEELMAELRYPRLAEHREHHRQCLETMTAILQPPEPGGPAKEDLDEAFGLLVDSIVRVDLYFEEFLVGQGELPDRPKPL